MTNKFSFLKNRIIFLFLVINLCSAVFSQPAQNFSQNSQNQDSVQFSSQDGAGQFNFSETEIEPPNDGISTVGMFFKMILSLGVVILIVFLIARIFKRSMGIVPSQNDSLLRKVAYLSMEPGRSVQIVTLLDRAYILGVSDNSVNLISEIDDKELVESLNLLADKNQNVSKPKSFADVLEIFVGKGSMNKSAFSDNARNVTDILKRQRNRFNKGE